MSFFNWLFKKTGKTVNCPRCLGKGIVEWDDIKRLRKELKWLPGLCAYCYGVGKVSSQMAANVAADETYLTTDLTSRERLLLINKHPETIMRAVSHEKNHDDFIEHIVQLHFTGKLNAENIADYYLQSGPEMEFQDYVREKKILIEFINKVIELHSE